MKTIVSSNIRIQNPTAELVAYIKDYLKIQNPEYITRQHMGKWLGKCPQYLYLYEERGDSIVVPFGCLMQIHSFLRQGEIEWSRNEKMVETNPEAVPLYDYQSQAVTQCLISCGGILQSPAGSGKTQMGISLFCQAQRKCLWLTKTLDLLNQSKERAERYIPKELIGTIASGKVNIGKGITFATIQTMAKLDLTSLRDEWSMIIVDECHNVAGTPTAITQFYKVLNNLNAPYKYGLSATVHRSDGTIKTTFALLGDIIYTVPKEAVADKIMPVTVRPVYTSLQLGYECFMSDGMLSFPKMINYLCGSTGRSRMIVGLIERGQSCLVLSDRVEHLRYMITILPEELRKDAVIIDGTMTTKAQRMQRALAIEEMRAGQKKILFATYALAKEGLDIPCLTRLYLTTPHKDYAVITQAIGRIARSSAGKTRPVCYDFVDDDPYLNKCYKKRLTIYRKNGCDID